MNKTYALVTWACTTAIGRRCGPTYTLSGCTRTVETDEHAASVIASTPYRSEAICAQANTGGDRIGSVARGIASYVIAALLVAARAGAQPAPVDVPPEEALDRKLAVWRFDALGIDPEI